MDNQSPQYLKSSFIKSTKKYTFLRISLPMMFFNLASFVFFILALWEKNKNINGYYYFIYITIIFIIFSLSFFIPMIKGEKVYVVKRGKNIQYSYISKTKYEQILQSFDAKITK